MSTDNPSRSSADAADGMYAEAREVYARQRVGGGRFGLGTKPGLLIVDFQQLYTRGRASTGLAAVEQTARLLDVQRAAGLPVAYARVSFPGTATPADAAWTRKCPGLLEAADGSWEAQIDPLIAPRAGEPVLDKQVPSAFFAPTLRSFFIGHGVDTVLVAGTSTSGCVRATVVDGVSHGFAMVVVRECVADRSAPSEAAALFDIETKYGDIATLEAVLDHLSALPPPRTRVSITGTDGWVRS